MLDSLKNFWNDRPTLLEFGRMVVWSAAMAIAAAFGVAIVYSICVMILLLEPVY